MQLPFLSHLRELDLDDKKVLAEFAPSRTRHQHFFFLLAILPLWSGKLKFLCESASTQGCSMPWLSTAKMTGRAQEQGLDASEHMPQEVRSRDSPEGSKIGKGPVPNNTLSRAAVFFFFFFFFPPFSGSYHGRQKDYAPLF